jgi:hypothetical protein
MLKLPPPSADSGRRAFFDAKQLGLEQGFDQRCTVDGDKRTVPSSAQLVDLTSDKLLAYTALALQRPVVERGGSPLICPPITWALAGGKEPEVGMSLVQRLRPGAATKAPLLLRLAKDSSAEKHRECARTTTVKT